MKVFLIYPFKNHFGHRFLPLCHDITLVQPSKLWVFTHFDFCEGPTGVDSVLFLYCFSLWFPYHIYVLFWSKLFAFLISHQIILQVLSNESSKWNLYWQNHCHHSHLSHSHYCWEQCCQVCNHGKAELWDMTITIRSKNKKSCTTHHVALYEPIAVYCTFPTHHWDIFTFVVISIPSLIHLLCNFDVIGGGPRVITKYCISYYDISFSKIQSLIVLHI